MKFNTPPCFAVTLEVHECIVKNVVIWSEWNDQVTIELVLLKQQFWYQFIRIWHNTNISIYIHLGLDSLDYQTQTWIEVKGQSDD